MDRQRVRREIRRLVVIAALVATSAAVSMWRPGLQTSKGAITVVNLFVPPIFTGAHAAGPVPVGGCTGTPVPPGDKLAITLKKISLVDSANKEVTVLDQDSTLDFAQNAGATVGDFAPNKLVDNATYTKMKVTVGSTLTILCSVTCNAGDGGGVKTWYTSGLPGLTAPDGNVAPAKASAITIGSGNTPYEVSIVPALTVSNNSAATLSIFFSNISGCELNDISSLLGNAALTNLKVLPKLPSPTKVQ